MNKPFIKSFSFSKEIEDYLIHLFGNKRCKTSDIIKFSIPKMNGSFSDKLKFFIKGKTNNLSRQFKEIYPFFQKEFDELFAQIGLEDDTRFRKLVLFLTGKLKRCKHCGKITEREYCSRKCANSSHTEESIKLQRSNSVKTMFNRYGGFYSSTDKFKTDVQNYYKKKCIDGHKPECFKNFENLNVTYIFEHFVKNNKFLAKEMQQYFNCSPSFVNKFKKFNNIFVENKREFAKSQIQEELFNWIPCENKISNSRQIIKPLEIDIFLPDNKLAIEYNGSYWHSFKDKRYHLIKTEKCLEQGIQLFHIFDFDNLEIWKSMISNKLGCNTKIYARKCNIKELEYNEVKNFLNENHLQGACSSKINLGLFYNDELVEVMTFGIPRFNKKYNYELLRLCSKKFYTVVGGASKLFKYFSEHYTGSVISYANLRFSNGNIYEQLGFKEIRTTEPNYWYVNEFEILSRYQCQKHKLKNILENFDDNLSETENMELNGYIKVYDCGNKVYEKVL